MSNSGSSDRVRIPLTDEQMLSQIFEQVNLDCEEEVVRPRSEWLKVQIARYFLQLMNHGLRENLLQLDSVGTDVANNLIRNRPYRSIREVRTRNGFSGQVLGEMIKNCCELFVRDCS